MKSALIWKSYVAMPRFADGRRFRQLFLLLFSLEMVGGDRLTTDKENKFS